MVLIDMDELANLHVMYAGLLEPGARGLRDRRSHGEDYAHYITACRPPPLDFKTFLRPFYVHICTHKGFRCHVIATCLRQFKEDDRSEGQKKRMLYVLN